LTALQQAAAAGLAGIGAFSRIWLQKTAAVELPRGPHPQDLRRLFKRRLNASKGRVQICAEALHDRDDRDSDAGGDEPIFDGSRARLVFKKTCQEFGHVSNPLQFDPSK
jgi:hypothetical protein